MRNLHVLPRFTYIQEMVQAKLWEDENVYICHECKYMHKIGFAVKEFNLMFKKDVQRYICDFICENLSYGGTNSGVLDQLFIHVCDNIYG